MADDRPMLSHRSEDDVLAEQRCLITGLEMVPSGMDLREVVIVTATSEHGYSGTERQIYMFGMAAEDVPSLGDYVMVTMSRAPAPQRPL